MGFVSSDCAVGNYRAAGMAVDPAAADVSSTAGYIAVDNCGATVCAADSTAGLSITVSNCETIKDRIDIFSTVEIEAAMFIMPQRPITINYCSCNSVWVVRLGASDGDGFAKEIDITVSGAGVGAEGNDDLIAVIRIVDS